MSTGEPSSPSGDRDIDTGIRPDARKPHSGRPHVHAIKYYQSVIYNHQHSRIPLYNNTTVRFRCDRNRPYETYNVSITNAEEGRMDVDLGKDVTLRLLGDFRQEQEAVRSREYLEYAAFVRPAPVNWHTDMIYVDLPDSTEPGWDLVVGQPWTDKIQRLAIHFDQSFIDNLGSRLLLENSIREEKRWEAESNLAPFIAMKELVFVVSPLPEWEGYWRQRPRDTYGFAPFDLHRENGMGLAQSPVAFRQIVGMYRCIMSQQSRRVRLRTVIILKWV